MKTKTVIQLSAVAVGIYVIYKAQQTVTEIVTAPIEFIKDNNNPINQGFNSLYSKATGSSGTLGGDLADLFYD